jgi:glycosyltransferase involved in cell wall biosynthesis
MSVRILMIIPQVFYSTRGTPISAYHRIRELISYGHEVEVLTYKLGASPPDLDIRIYRSHGPHFANEIKAGPSRLKIWFDVLLFVNLIYRLSRRRYDALYAHEEGAFLARIVGAVFRTPYVYDMHSSLPRQIRDWGFSRKQWVVSLFGWIERFCVQGARVVVAISPAVEQVARTVRPDAPVVVIVNHYEIPVASAGFDAQAARARHGIDPQAKLVVYTGSFVALQALDMLIACAPIVLAQVPNVTFLLVGGAQKEIDELTALAAKYNVADHFIFEKTRPQYEMPGYMAAADVLVSPRVAGINPPGKLVSYLAAARPVVATNTLVHSQILDSSRAILTDPTPQQFAEGVITGLTDPKRGMQVVLGARAFLQTYCSAEARRSAYKALADHLTSTPYARLGH